MQPSHRSSQKYTAVSLIVFGLLLAGRPVLCAGPAQQATPADRGAAAAPAKPGPGWPQFLGANRNGTSAETGLLTEWPENGPKEVWRVPGGIGMSGLAIHEGKLVTLVQRQGKQRAVCLDARNGKELWGTDVAPAYRNQMGDGPRATPAIGGGAVYVFTGEGILAGLSLADGRIAWQVNLIEKFDGAIADYGMASSPLVVEGRVIVTIGAGKATVVAVDARTGDIAWTAGSDHPAGYSSAALLKVGGREQLVVFHGNGALGLDPKNGTELWSHSYVTDFNCNIATPLAIDDGVLISSGENHGSTLLGLTPKGSKFDVVERWTSQGAKSTLRNEWQTSVVVDGALYGFDNVGSAGPVTHLTCLDPRTGERKWQQLRFGKGNLIAADGKLFVSTMLGELVVLKADPRHFVELGRKAILEKTRTAPALADGLLYLRDDHEIVCLDVRK